MKHSFTEKIDEILAKYFKDNAKQVFKNSELIQYINQKTVSAHKGSKARGSFGNLYAIYVLVEDYLDKKFDKEGDYSKYEGAKFSDLFTRQRELPFGAGLQNHALNHRMNQEFKKKFSNCDFIPITRESKTKRYWINPNLIELEVNKEKVNISHAIIEIIEEYIKTKRSALESFIQTCEELKDIGDKEVDKIKLFISGLLQPNVDARMFEIVSYSILKASYFEQFVFFGFTLESIEKENLKLYKTGRTNANDGGIDFVMKPLGRFFQVTETTDVKKYFLDIDKLEKFPITFVVKSTEKVEGLKQKIKEGAKQQYGVEAVVNKYVACIEEIINIQKLKETLDEVEKIGKINEVLNEIIKQSKVEFNYDEDIIEEIEEDDFK
ncbi:hypothetical protein ACE193_23895 [Bernardetia sp. OM2101]|uniref:hypothetical protein n=1 Tax=Bernardetia sp. OM2101 TaxID=3344876 RepID=UPI0035D00CB5